MVIEKLDDERCIINGVLINLPLIQKWIETTPFGAHTPVQTFYNLRNEMARDDPEERKLLHFLDRINAFGYRIEDAVFSSIPGYYRYLSGFQVIYWSSDPVATEVLGAPVRPLWDVEYD